VLLIGIIIFSEIAEAMEVTLPIGFPAESDEWQLREQQFNATNTVNCQRLPATNWIIEFNAGRGFDQLRSGHSVANQGYCHVFKVFDKSIITGKDLTVRWEGTRTFFDSSPDYKILVLDGSYDRNTSSDFPLDPTVNGAGFTTPLKGAGKLHEVTRTGSPNQIQTDIIPMTLAGSTESKITVAVTVVDDTINNNILEVSIVDIKIDDVGLWAWTVSGASVTMAVTGTNDDKGVANADFVNLKTALPLTPEEQQQVDTFNNAQAIGFTVIGILPVALFFALFSIFSGRLE